MQRLLPLGCRQVGARFIPLVQSRKRADPRHPRGSSGYGTIGITLTAPRGVAYAIVRFFPPLAAELYDQRNGPGRSPREAKKCTTAARLRSDERRLWRCDCALGTSASCASDCNHACLSKALLRRVVYRIL